MTFSYFAPMGKTASIFAAASMLAGCSDLCRNDVLSTAAAPGGKLQAVVFTRNCGATTGYSTQVALLPTGRTLPNKGGNVFVANRGDGPRGPLMEVDWVAADQLIVTYDQGARLFLQEANLLGVRVTYRPVDPTRLSPNNPPR